MQRNILAPALFSLVALLAACQHNGNVRTTDLPEGATLKQSDGIFSMPYVEGELPNGLKVVIVRTDYPDVVSLQIPMQTGSRNEVEPGKSGFAHFFEHMMFRGTEKYSQDEYREILKKAGADQNAYTSDDITNYHITFTRADLEKVIELEADRFRNLQYTEEQFRTEALAVKGEYLKNAANPLRKAFEVMRNLHYDTHPYEHTTMGFLEDIEQMPEQFAYSRTFFKRWYRPGKATVVVAGDLDPQQTWQWIEQYWGGWQAADDVSDIEIPAEPAARGPQYQHVQFDSPTQPWVFVSYRGPAFDANEKDMAAMDLVQALYFSSQSDIHRELVIEKQMADFLGASFPNRTDPGLLTVYARLNDAKHAAAVTERIIETFAEARSRLVDAGKLHATKSNLKYSFARGLDNSDAIAATLASFSIYNRNPVDTINAVYARYDALDADDVRHYANRYFTDARQTVVSLSNDASLPGLAKPASVDALAAAFPPQAGGPTPKPARWDSSAHERALAKRRNPDNRGAKVVALPGSADLVDINLLFEVGAARDPANRKGLAQLTAMMVVDGGSRFHDITSIQQAYYPLASGLDAQVDKEMTRFSGVVHRDNLQKWYVLAMEQLLNPGWRESDFSRIKTQLVNEIRSGLRGNNDEEFAKEVLYETIYGKQHPYGSLNLGHVKDIEAITLDDVKLFYARYYTPANLTIGLAGGFDNAFRETLETDLTALPQSGPSELELPAAPKLGGRHVTIIEKNSQSVAVSFGFPLDINRSNEDWVALWLARSWLGEHRSSNSHLYQRIREARGMNYGDYAYIEYFPRGMFRTQPDANLGRQQQIFQVWLRPLRNNSDAHFATRIAIHELDKLIRNGMSQADFDNTRDFLEKFVAQLANTQGRQLAYRLDSEYYGTPAFTDMVRNKLATLTVDDVNRVIRKHLQTDNLQMVFISANANDLKQRLATDAVSAPEYPTTMPADIIAEDRLLRALPLNLHNNRIRIVKAEQLFE